MNVLFQWIFAHLLGDFVLQTKQLVAHKRRLKQKSWMLYTHCLLHGSLVYIFSPDKTLWVIPVTVIASHFCIDLWKLNAKNNLLSFIIDQLLHLTVLIALWLIYYQQSGWLQTFIQQALSNAKFWIITAGYIIIIYPLSFVLGYATQKWRQEIELNISRSIVSLSEAGKWIGIFERILVFTFVITNHFEGIGFLIAAKSILRFSDIKGDHIRKEAEYVLIGTLMSFSSSILTGLGVMQLIN